MSFLFGAMKALFAASVAVMVAHGLFGVPVSAPAGVFDCSDVALWALIVHCGVVNAERS